MNNTFNIIEQLIRQQIRQQIQQTFSEAGLFSELMGIIRERLAKQHIGILSDRGTWWLCIDEAKTSYASFGVCLSDALDEYEKRICQENQTS